MYDVCRRGGAPKDVPSRTKSIHKKRVLFVVPLFVGKLSDFQLRTAWSHFPYFTSDHSDSAKLGKSFNHAKQHSKILAPVYRSLPFLSVCH